MHLGQSSNLVLLDSIVLSHARVDKRLTSRKPATEMSIVMTIRLLLVLKSDIKVDLAGLSLQKTNKIPILHGMKVGIKTRTS